MKNIKKLFISKDSDINTILKKMENISGSTLPKGIILVVDKNNRLLGTITDGDIRRSYKIKNKILLAEDIMNRNPLTFQHDVTYEKVIAQLPEKLGSRKNKSRKFLSNIILVKNKIPNRIINYHELWQNFELDDKKITVIGLGYVGITLSLALADTGMTVYGYDIDEEKINSLNDGNIYVHELGLERLLNEQRNKMFFPSNSINYDTDIFIICVSTPIKEDRNNKFTTDLKFIKNAVQDISKKMKKGSLVVLRSTIPIGLTRSQIIPLIEKTSGFKCGIDFSISFAPERTIEGMAMKELRDLPQIIGGYDQKSFEKTSKIFSRLTSTIVKVDSIESAEMIKLMNNSFRDYVFAFSNNLSLIASEYNIDITQAIKSANKGYPRNPIPYPSPGVGGPCLTKDPFIFSSILKSNKNDLFSMSRKINIKMHDHIVKSITKQIHLRKIDFSNFKMLICGLAFKGDPETGDLRNSSSIEIYRMFLERNIKVYGFDFVAKKEDIKKENIDYYDIKNGLKGFDALLFLNNHKKNEELDFFRLVRQMNEFPIFFDGWSQFLKNEIKQIRRCTYMNLSSISISMDNISG